MNTPLNTLTTAGRRIFIGFVIAIIAALSLALAAAVLA
jgi:hypothetical protein